MSGLIRSFDRLPDGINPNLEDSLNRLGSVAQDLSYVISMGDVSDEVQNEVSVNSDGDDQKPLDVYADQAYLAKMIGSPIRFYASE